MTDDRAFGADDVAGASYVGKRLRKLRFLMTGNTATQDYSLFHILRDYRLNLWKTQAAGVAARNGLLSFIVHRPDHLLESQARNTYHDLLGFLSRCRSERGMWIATTANQVNRWWRLRSRMTLVERHGSWHIDGSGVREGVRRFRENQWRAAVLLSRAEAL